MGSVLGGVRHVKKINRKPRNTLTSEAQESIIFLIGIKDRETFTFGDIDLLIRNITNKNQNLI